MGMLDEAFEVKPTRWQRQDFSREKRIYRGKKTISLASVIMEIFHEGSWSYIEICEYMGMPYQMVFVIVSDGLKREAKQRKLLAEQKKLEEAEKAKKLLEEEKENAGQDQ